MEVAYRNGQNDTREENADICGRRRTHAEVAAHTKRLILGEFAGRAGRRQGDARWQVMRQYLAKFASLLL
jgi:hypothetical protein